MFIVMYVQDYHAGVMKMANAVLETIIIFNISNIIMFFIEINGIALFGISVHSN